jgi:hypothetical protein
VEGEDEEEEGDLDLERGGGVTRNEGGIFRVSVE